MTVGAIMDSKKEIELPYDYILKIIGAYEDRGHEVVSQYQVKQIVLALEKKGLETFDDYNTNWALERNLEILSGERDKNLLSGRKNKNYYLRRLISRYSLTDYGRKYLETTIIPIAGNERRIFYDTIGEIPFNS